MVELEKVLKNLCQPMCANPEALDVRVMPSLNENEILLYVYAKDEDVAKLIGKQGVMANSLRQMVAVASLEDHKRIVIKFETI